MCKDPDCQFCYQKLRDFVIGRKGFSHDLVRNNLMYPFKKGLFSLNSNMKAVKLAALEAGNFHLATKPVGQEASVEAVEMTMKRL